MKKSHSWFSRLAKKSSDICGKSVAFSLACLVLIIWAATGPIFQFSDTWQLVINTGTTIVTFLMVFLIQNTQNRENEAVQIKLDEIIRVLNGAHNTLLEAEEEGDEVLDGLLSKYKELGKEAKQGLIRGESDTGSPDIANGFLKENSTKKASMP